LSSPGIRKDGSQVSLEFSMVLLRLNHMGCNRTLAEGKGTEAEAGSLRVATELLIKLTHKSS
jgi:hypothetical protein